MKTYKVRLTLSISSDKKAEQAYSVSICDVHGNAPSPELIAAANFVATMLHRNPCDLYAELSRCAPKKRRDKR